MAHVTPVLYNASNNSTTAPTHQQALLIAAALRWGNNAKCCTCWGGCLISLGLGFEAVWCGAGWVVFPSGHPLRQASCFFGRLRLPCLHGVWSAVFPPRHRRSPVSTLNALWCSSPTILSTCVSLLAPFCFWTADARRSCLDVYRAFSIAFGSNVCKQGSGSSDDGDDLGVRGESLAAKRERREAKRARKEARREARGHKKHKSDRRDSADDHHRKKHKKDKKDDRGEGRDRKQESSAGDYRNGRDRAGADGYGESRRNGRDRGSPTTTGRASGGGGGGADADGTWERGARPSGDASFGASSALSAPPRQGEAPAPLSTGNVMDWRGLGGRGAGGRGGRGRGRGTGRGGREGGRGGGRGGRGGEGMNSLGGMDRRR